MPFKEGEPEEVDESALGAEFKEKLLKLLGEYDKKGAPLKDLYEIMDEIHIDLED